jgi:hypothetical protein
MLINKDKNLLAIETSPMRLQLTIYLCVTLFLKRWFQGSRLRHACQLPYYL